MRPTETSDTPRRGRIDKRQAILAAATRMFARDGYALANIDTIAAEAGVAKPTVYSHLGTKENLFRTVMLDAADTSRDRILATLDAFPTDPPDAEHLAAGLVAVAHQVIACQLSEDGWVLQRLLYAEAGRFPDLYRAVKARGGAAVVDAIAGKLARLSVAGHLVVPDPARAAGQFMTLISADLPDLTALGTRPADGTALDESVTAAVHMFLRAYRPDRAEA